MRLIGVLGVLVLCAGLPAQVILSTIRGTVVDPTGAVIANAEITLVHQETNAKRTTPTNRNGDFELAGLDPGTYRVSVTSAGFKTAVVENVILEIGEVRRLNVALEVGAVGTELTVSAGASVISLETARVEGSVMLKKYPDSPWINLNSSFLPQSMLTTLPLLQQIGAAWTAQWAGQSTAQVQQGEDGHTNDGFANQLNDVFDAAEIVVVEGNPTADIARVGYFNEVTKSGSNQFHVQVLYMNVNSALAARQFFSPTKVATRQNTFANGVSGPIIKNKTFFYTSYNIADVGSSQFFLQSVPTAQMRGGDFSQLLSLASPVVIKDPLTGAPFPGNMVPASRLNPLSLKVNNAYLPAPNLGGPNTLVNNYGYTFPWPTDLHIREDFTVRVDHYLTAKNRVMFRLIRDDTRYVLSSNGYPGFLWTRNRHNYHIVGEDTHVFSPTFVNAARVGWYREKIDDGVNVSGQKPVTGSAAIQYLGLQGVNPQNLSAQGFPSMTITGVSSTSSETLFEQPGGMSHLDHNWGFADTMTWSKGKHVIKFGAEYKPFSNNIQTIKEGTYGQFTFNGTFTGNGYADFMLGIPYSSSRLNQLSNRTQLDSEFGPFITDDFKVSKRLTLSLGVRWDRFGSPSWKDGLLWNFDPATGNIVVPKSVFSAISPFYPTTIPIVAGQATTNPSNLNIAPRIGGAYRLSDQFVIRAAYGIYTETEGRYARLNTGGPFEISELYYNQIVNSQPLFSFPNPFPGSTGTATAPSQSFTGYPLDTSNGRIHQFNLTLERQVKDVGLRITYLGSRNRGMNYLISIDKPQPSLTPFSASREPYPQFASGSYWRSNGEQNYNALTFEAQRKVGQVTFDGHWTWASNMSNMLNVQNPYAPLTWSRDPNTSRHRVVINALWRIPVGRGQRFLPHGPAVVDNILGGWQLYWIAYFETGRYFSPSFSGSDPSNTNTSGGLPDRICNGNLPTDQRSISHWFDASCFAVPAKGRFGNSGVNILEGPGNALNNISLAKTFSLTERLRFTLTAAAEDAFNHPNFNFSSVAANISSPGTVATISSLSWAGGSRVIELRGRIDF